MPVRRKDYRRKLKGKEGFDFVVCRICGDRRQVISGRHLSKHVIERITYMAEYGLSPDELIAKAFQLNRSRRKAYRVYSKNEWAIALRSIFKRTGNIFAGDLQKRYPHVYTQGVRIHGDWNKALRAAGFDPDKMRKRVIWTDQEVISKLQALHQREVPLYAKYVMNHYGAVFHAGLQRFGSWPKVLSAAGIVASPQIKRFARDQLSLLNKLSAALYDQPRAGVSAELRSAAVLCFGSFEKALAELRKREQTLPGWNKHKIIAILLRMHWSKTSLKYKEVRTDGGSLVSAAERLFGSWRSALLAAGIEPNVPRRSRKNVGF